MNTTPAIITSGPIVACQNGIDHYVKALKDQENETDRLRRLLAASLDAERVLDGMLSQWVQAKAALQREMTR